MRVGKGEDAPSDLDPEIGMTSSIAFSKVMVGVMCRCCVVVMPPDAEVERYLSLDSVCHAV